MVESFYNDSLSQVPPRFQYPLKDRAILKEPGDGRRQVRIGAFQYPLKDRAILKGAGAPGRSSLLTWFQYPLKDRAILKDPGLQDEEPISP